MTPTTIDEAFLRSFLRGREAYSSKRDYGHALLVCGCSRMPGAAILATDAALHSGCGLVTLHTCEIAARAAMTVCPGAMLSLEEGGCFSTLPDKLDRYTCIGVGPGLGTAQQSISALSALIRKAEELSIPMVLDADALNILSREHGLLHSIPPGSVMTPHEGELRRLTHWESEEGKMSAASALSSDTGCVVVSKGFHTSVHLPGGQVLCNTTGNPGMAKGGSGDVLTGLITGLMARGYSSDEAAPLGVWLHGYAGDLLTERFSPEGYSSKDLIPSLGEAFRQLYQGK